VPLELSKLLTKLRLSRTEHPDLVGVLARWVESDSRTLSLDLKGRSQNANDPSMVLLHKTDEAVVWQAIAAGSSKEAPKTVLTGVLGVSWTALGTPGRHAILIVGEAILPRRVYGEDFLDLWEAYCERKAVEPAWLARIWFAFQVGWLLWGLIKHPPKPGEGRQKDSR